MSQESAAYSAVGFTVCYVKAAITLGIVAETIVYGMIGAATAYLTSEVLKAAGISKGIHKQINKLKQWLKKKEN